MAIPAPHTVATLKDPVGHDLGHSAADARDKPLMVGDTLAMVMA